MAASLLALAPLAAAAHDYTEFAPLEPGLRGALVEVLEDVAAGGALSSTEPADNLEELLDALDDAARGDLARRLRQRAGVETPARLPDSVILPLFYDLANFAMHIEEHESDPPQDGQGAADYRHLQDLLERVGVR